MSSKSGFAMALVGAIAMAQAASLSSAFAQEKNLSVDLNDMADIENACRMTFVVNNQTDIALDKTAYNMVVFGLQGKVARLIVFDFGRIPVGKTRVFQFDISAIKCEGISRLLINDAADCESAGQPSPVCIDRLTTTTTTSIVFGS